MVYKNSINTAFEKKREKDIKRSGVTLQSY